MSHGARDNKQEANGTMNIRYATEPELTVAEFVEVLRASTLAERRPIDDLPRIEAMLRNADLIITARAQDNRLVGVSRAISDFAYCTYLSDLAVAADFQRQGIGRELIRRTHEAAGRQTKLFLVAAPKAVHYYPHIGMINHPSCWMAPAEKPNG